RHQEILDKLGDVRPTRRVILALGGGVNDLLHVGKGVTQQENVTWDNDPHPKQTGQRQAEEKVEHTEKQRAERHEQDPSGTLEGIDKGAGNGREEVRLVIRWRDNLDVQGHAFVAAAPTELSRPLAAGVAGDAQLAKVNLAVRTEIPCRG